MGTIAVRDSDRTRENLLWEIDYLKQKLADYDAIQAQLSHQQKHLDETQQLTHTGSWQWSLAEQSLIWSDEVYRIFGVEPQSFQPSVEAFEAMIHPDDLQPFLQQREQMLNETQSATIDHRIVLPDGEIRHVQERTQLIFNAHNEVVRVIGTVQDITESKKIEIALRDSEDKYRKLVELSPEAIGVYSEGKVVYANPVALQLLGADRLKDLIGVSIMTLIHPDFHEIARQRMQQMAETNQFIPTIEAKFVRLDGQVIDVETTSVPIIYGGKQAIQVIFRDVSRRKQAQEHLLRLELERERIHILSKFITSASHEFRTPLAAINTSAYLQSKAETPEKKAQLLHKIEQQTRVISKLVDALNTMSELDSMGELTLTKSNLCEIVSEVHLLMQSGLEKKQLHSAVELTANPLMARVHRQYLELALKAILANAIRFTPEEGTIHISVTQEDGQARIEIRDNGIGISSDDLPHIFDRFYRSDESGTMSGFGLGLALSRRIIELHHGTIEAESHIDEGTAIRIYLPLM